MTISSRLSLFIVIFCGMMMMTTVSFLPVQTTSSTQHKSMLMPSNTPSPQKLSFVVLYGSNSTWFEQKPGESDTAWMKRITNETPPSSTSKNTSTKPAVTGKYQRIEDWEADRQQKGELTWEEKVQFDGQRFGNQVRQNDILSRHIGSFF